MKKLTILVWTALLGGAIFSFSSCYKKYDVNSYRPPLNIGGFSSSKEIAPSNLVGYWAFDGSYIDSVSKQSGRNFGTTFSPGVKGQAMQGAKDAYVLFTPGASIAGMNSFTIMLWVNSDVPSDGIIGLVGLSNKSNFWGDLDMFFENGSTATAGKFRTQITSGTKDAWVAKDGLSGLFNNWVHLTLSYDAGTSTFKLYQNGSLQHTQTNSGFGPLTFTNSGDMVFGTVQFMTKPSLTSSHGAEPWASFLTGQLDEVRIYNKALSDNEVSSLVKLEGRGK